jgi:dTDP-4-dehydrorhamnose 3,5-epimerase
LEGGQLKANQDLTLLKWHGLKKISVRKIWDGRGWFVEPYAQQDFNEIGLSENFTQESHSLSYRNVFRGLHYQTMKSPMGKLVRCTKGELVDFAVDLRLGSPTYAKTYHTFLYGNDNLINWIWIPPGFAHGFLCMSDVCEVQYKQTGTYNKKEERSLDGLDLNLDVHKIITRLTGMSSGFIRSEKDTSAMSFDDYSFHPDFYFSNTAPHVFGSESLTEDLYEKINCSCDNNITLTGNGNHCACQHRVV